MVLAGEAERTEALDGVEDVLARVLRALRPEAISVAHARDVQYRVISIEKAAASIKLLVAGRAAEGQSEKAAAADLARRTGTTVSKARSALDASKQLADQPAVSDAVRAGRLSEDQAKVITDAVDKNPTAAPTLLEEAEHGSMRTLHDACGKAKADADADEEATHARHHARRSLRTSTDLDGAFLGFLRSTTVDGARFTAFLQPFREQIFTANHEAGIRDPFEAVEHDALMAMAAAAHAAITGTADTVEPQSGAAVKPPATVYVVADFDRLVGGRDGGESAYVAGFGNVPSSVVREILDDAFLVGVVMHGTEVAKIRRWGKHIPAAVRDALMVKHRFRCSTPGCGNWARIEIDHLHPRGRGGETSYRNCDPKCDDCHDEKSAQERLVWDDIPFQDSG